MKLGKYNFVRVFLMIVRFLILGMALSYVYNVYPLYRRVSLQLNLIGTEVMLFRKELQKKVSAFVI